MWHKLLNATIIVAHNFAMFCNEVVCFWSKFKVRVLLIQISLWRTLALSIKWVNGPRVLGYEDWLCRFVSWGQVITFRDWPNDFDLRVEVGNVGFYYFWRKHGESFSEALRQFSSDVELMEMVNVIFSNNTVDIKILLSQKYIKPNLNCLAHFKIDIQNFKVHWILRFQV